MDALHPDDTRPHKRPREDEDSAKPEGDVGGDQVDLDVTKLAVRDETYYKEDGDCVILVGKFLFKIHSTLLKRDVPAFSKMFKIPEDANIQVSTDEAPIVLVEDVEDIRALCWITYALPTVCMQQSSLATADIPNLVSLYTIARKYGFRSHREFALEMLTKICRELGTSPSKLPDYFITCPQSRLRTLLQGLSGTRTLQNIWITRLKKTNESVSYALKVADDLQFRNFMATLLYLQITRVVPAPLEGSTAYRNPADHLALNHKAALFQGFWSLELYWKRTLKDIAQKSFECSNRRSHGCQRVWKRSWKESLESTPTTFDPLRELKGLQKEILGLGEGVHVPCASKAIETMINKLENSLVDHFFEPPP